MNSVMNLKPAKTDQQGLTLLGFLIVLAIVSFSAFIGLKLFPMYQEYYAVDRAMKALRSEPGIANRSVRDIKVALLKKFEISYVETPKERDIKITRSNGYQVRVKYEARKPLIGNLDVVLKFDKSVTLT